jgi:hypothetical protein
VTFGSGTRFTIASRPETEMTALVPLIPAFSTHSLMASVTTWGSRIVPSAMTSRGSGLQRETALALDQLDGLDDAGTNIEPERRSLPTESKQRHIRLPAFS